MRALRGARSAGALGGVLLLLAGPAAATGLTPSPKKPAGPAMTDGVPTGIYLRTPAGFVPLTKGKISVATADGIKRFFVPLGPGTLPAAAAPIQARDALPADENYWLLRLRDDGQVFAWNVEGSYFEEPIEFGARFDSQTDKVLTWNSLEPGIWAFVQSQLTSIGEICYPFRVLSAPLESAPAR